MNPPDRQQIAAAWEEAGFLSQGDYAKLQGLTDIIQQGGTLADADLEWLVTLLESTTEAIVRSRVMVMLAAAQPTLFPQQYKERIDAAIAPHMDSANRLDRLSAAHMQRALNGG